MQYILLCKERNEVYPVEAETLNIPLLRARTRMNPELEYYILKYNGKYGITPEAFIKAIQKCPGILEKSDMIQKI